jgi:hypothetical protein
LDELLRLASATRVLGLLAARLDLDAIAHPRLRARLVSARQEAQSRRRELRWELDRLAQVFAGIEMPLVLLKGAAYEAAGLPTSVGRISADLDLLVPRSQLAAIEERLLQSGWEVADLSDRHEQYFRTWLHELPPLKHRERGTMLDVHHTILPRTDTLQVDADELIARAVPAGDGPFRTLSPEDMVLHSAVHLFRNGNFKHAIRDLWDVDRLVRHFSSQPGFGERLRDRVAQFRMASPCYFALTSARELFNTPSPSVVDGSLESWKPAWPRAALMQRLLSKALAPRELDRIDTSRERALLLLAYWPLPRLRTLLSPLFWAKRLQRMHPQAPAGNKP